MTRWRRTLARLGLATLAGLAAPAAIPLALAEGPIIFVSPWADDWLDLGLNTEERERWQLQRLQKQQRKRVERQWTFMNGMVPVPYRGRTSPLEPTPGTLAAGSVVYQANCAGCHGRNGFGDGDNGRSLSPSPALLNFLVQMPGAVDEYLFWSVAEGGPPFGSEMPAFKDRLTDDQIWQVIAYMRAGFPGAR